MMQLEDVVTEYEKKGALSKKAIEFLKSELQGPDPYPVITVVSDCGVFEASEELSKCLESDDRMVRWNATAALFTRLRNPYYAQECYDLATRDPDVLVRVVALCGVGEILRSVSDKSLQQRMAGTLIRAFEDDSELLEIRGAAYEGILAALDIPPEERPAADALINLETDVDWNRVEIFRGEFL